MIKMRERRSGHSQNKFRSDFHKFGNKILFSYALRAHKLKMNLTVENSKKKEDIIRNQLIKRYLMLWIFSSNNQFC